MGLDYQILLKSPLLSLLAASAPAYSYTVAYQALKHLLVFLSSCNTSRAARGHTLYFKRMFRAEADKIYKYVVTLIDSFREGDKIFYTT